MRAVGIAVALVAVSVAALFLPAIATANGIAASAQRCDASEIRAKIDYDRAKQDVRAQIADMASGDADLRPFNLALFGADPAGALADEVLTSTFLCRLITPIPNRQPKINYRFLSVNRFEETIIPTGNSEDIVIIRLERHQLFDWKIVGVSLPQSFQDQMLSNLPS